MNWSISSSISVWLLAPVIFLPFAVMINKSHLKRKRIKELVNWTLNTFFSYFSLKHQVVSHSNERLYSLETNDCIHSQRTLVSTWNDRSYPLALIVCIDLKRWFVSSWNDRSYSLKTIVRINSKWPLVRVRKPLENGDNSFIVSLTTKLF